MWSLEKPYISPEEADYVPRNVVIFIKKLMDFLPVLFPFILVSITSIHRRHFIMNLKLSSYSLPVEGTCHLFHLSWIRTLYTSLYKLAFSISFIHAYVITNSENRDYFFSLTRFKRTFGSPREEKSPQIEAEGRVTGSRFRKMD